MTFLQSAITPNMGHLGDNYALEPSRIKTRPKYPRCSDKADCPDKAVHHENISVAF